MGSRAYRAALADLANTAAELGAALVNVADYRTAPLPAGEIVRFQKQLGFTFLDLPSPQDPDLRLSTSDPHFNPEGHALLAERIMMGLMEEGVCLPDEH